MSGVPRGVAAPVPIVVAYLRATFAVFRTRPVTAGMVAFFPRKVGRAIGLGTCQDVVFVWLVTAPVDQIAVFIQRIASGGGSIEQLFWPFDMAGVGIAVDGEGQFFCPLSLRKPRKILGGTEITSYFF